MARSEFGFRRVCLLCAEEPTVTEGRLEDFEAVLLLAALAALLSLVVRRVRLLSSLPFDDAEFSAAAVVSAVTGSGDGALSDARSPAARLPSAFSFAAMASRSSARLRCFSVTSFQLGSLRAEPGATLVVESGVDTADRAECGAEAA